MKTFLLRALPAGVFVLLTSWLLAAGEPPPSPPTPLPPAGGEGSKRPPAGGRGVGGEGSDVQDFVFLAEARPVLVRLHVRVDGKPLSSAWDDFMKRLFAYLDVNGDGMLSKQEAERAPATNSLVNLFGGINRGEGSQAKMEALDSDKDGKVSLSELSAYYRKSGFESFQFQLDLKPPDGGGFVALYSGGARPDPEVAALSKAIFALLDTDKDGKLTQKELDAAPALLLARDENEDEIITGQELVPPEKPSGNPFAAMMGGGKNAKAAGERFLVPVATPGQAPADLVRRMQERYDPSVKKADIKPLTKLGPQPAMPKSMAKTEPKPTKSYGPKPEGFVKEVKPAKEKDKGKETKKEPPCHLTRNQLGLDEATFARLDANKDGVLDNKEVAAFVQRSPDLCMVVSFGNKAGKLLDPAPIAGRPAALADKISLRDTVSLVDLGSTRMEMRRGDDKKGYNRLFDIAKQQYTALFKSADKNNDGYLDEKEVKDRREFNRIFKQVDRDGDGKITEKELFAYLDAMTELQQHATAACVTLVLRDQSRGLFDLLDHDRDGRLSVREINQAPKLLARLDRQGKGYVEAKDIPPCYQMTLRRGAAEFGFNQEAFFVERYFSEYKAEPSTARGPSWFRKMDRNRDGDVSRKEFLFSDELFRKIDSDGDGLISLEEAEKAGNLPHG